MRKTDNRSRAAIWTASAKRQFMWRFLSGRLPLYLVSEFPKCGGSWISQILADYLHVPFPRNETPPLRSCVMHGHHLYSPHYRNVFCVIRDGRDVMVSAYFHFLVTGGKLPEHIVQKFRDAQSFTDYDDSRKNMATFIDYMFTDYANRFNRFTWDAFILSYMGHDHVAMLRYEDMLRDSVGTMAIALQHVLGEEPDMQRLEASVEKFTFQQQTGRKPGEEDHDFLRKGIAGDWKNHFNAEACERFDHYAGKMLIQVGYEPNRQWIEEQRTRAERWSAV